MKTKMEIIAELKTKNPTLRVGSEELGYVDLNEADYEATIAEWADNALAEQALQAEAETQAAAKVALLERLGITEDEAKLLLG